MLSLFKNNQKWLTNSIPSKKVDNNDLIREILFKILVHFVEDEKGLVNMSWTDEIGYAEILEDIQNIYNWITEERQLLVDKLHQMHDNFEGVPVEADITDFLNTNGVSDILECYDILTDRDNKMLNKIIELRDCLIVI